jgi:hypothetical protein
VSAVDVLEHVPPEYRQAFLKRLAAFGKNTLIIGFPTSDSSKAVEADQAIDAQYFAVFGKHYSWLDEHIRFGLPSLAETVLQLSELGWNCQTVGHGHIPWLKELLSFVICVWGIPTFDNIVLDISEKFNRLLYSYDSRAPYYRQFIIASRNPLPPLILSAEKDNHADAEEIFRALMADAHKQYFKLSLKDCLRAASLRSQYDVAVVLAAQLQNSSSWRITRPLRFINNLVRDRIVNIIYHR